MADFEDYYDLGKAEMLIRRPDLFLNEGDVSDFLVAAGAAMADKNDQQANALAAKTYLDTAIGDDLTTLADDHWGIQRQAANAATVTLTFTRPTALAGGGTISAGAVIATDKDANGEDIRFTLDANVVFGGADLSKTGAATAEIAGISGNVDAGTITNIIDIIWDSTIVVTNAAVAVGGAEQESDEALRERVREYPSTLRRGTLAALEYGAKSVPGVAVATATEDVVTGIVTVYVTDASGNSNAQMVSDVEAELESWRCAGSVVTVLGGTVLTQAITVALTVRPTFDVVAMTTTIQDAIEERVNKLGIGETLYQTMIRTAVQNVRIDEILNVTVSAPASDLTPSANQVIRAGTITVA
jgi:uncharacterized phage protein gp47/JayE